MEFIGSSRGEEYEDGRSCDTFALKFIEDQWKSARMYSRSDEFTERRKFRVVCGTWNVNAKKLDGSSENQDGAKHIGSQGSSNSLKDWLLDSNSSVADADVYAIGFQELVDLNAMNVAMDGKTGTTN